MADGQARRRGKIAGLVRFDRESGGALDWDCMVQLGVRLADIPRAYGWDALEVFARHLPLDSATRRWASRDEASFASDIGRAALLADIFDAVRAFNASFAAKGTKPEPHMRPWKAKNRITYGSGAIPVSEFDEWYYEEA
jgi:hypothetical protein